MKLSIFSKICLFTYSFYCVRNKIMSTSFFIWYIYVLCFTFI